MSVRASVRFHCPDAASSSASSVASVNNSARGTIRSTRPSGCAISALMGLELRIILMAVCSPMRRGRRCVPPKPGMTPRLSSGRPSIAPGADRRA